MYFGLKITLLCCLFVLALPAQQKDTVRWYVQYARTGSYNRTNQFSSYLVSNSLKITVKKSDLKSNFKYAVRKTREMAQHPGALHL
jgi:hypothetical protein